MGSRLQPITPYNGSQGPSNRTKEAEPKVKVNFRMAAKRNIGQPDPLKQALTKPPPTYPTNQHSFSHGKTPQARGANYRPEGEYGRPTMGSLSKTSATNPKTGAPNRRGDNPLGYAPGRHGDNPLGRAMNRVGGNPLGHAPNRQGPNAIVGNPMNRRGGNGLPGAGYGGRGGGGGRGV